MNKGVVLFVLTLVHCNEPFGESKVKFPFPRGVGRLLIYSFESPSKMYQFTIFSEKKGVNHGRTKRRIVYGRKPSKDQDVGQVSLP